MRKIFVSTTAIVLVLLFLSGTVQAQEKQYRRYIQDPKLNNLVHADDYLTSEIGELGRVTKVGNGPRHMVLIAGAGFGGDIFDQFMNYRKKQFTMYAVTLPGYGGSQAPPMPAAGTSYGDQTWVRGVIQGIKTLIDENSLDKPVIVAHWYAATQIAFRLALDHPDAVDSVIIISGITRYGGGSLPAGTPIKQRTQTADAMSKTWFKTVTRDTWDDNNFMPGDYAVNPVRALQLWRQAASAPLPVWVRYLCESWSQDVTLEFNNLRVPVLVLKPGFDDDFYFQETRNYMKSFCHDSWEGAAEMNSLIEVRTIENSRVFIMDDQPDLLNKAVDAFVSSAH